MVEHIQSEIVRTVKTVQQTYLIVLRLLDQFRLMVNCCNHYTGKKTIATYGNQQSRCIEVNYDDSNMSRSS
jgi:hypothetical protein